MNDHERATHWDDIYRQKQDDVSWFEAEPIRSLALVDRCDLSRDAAVIDVGGGRSRFVEGVLDRGFHDVTVLDLSAVALEDTRARLGDRAAHVRFRVGDVTRFEPTERYALWHDRAVFHFLASAGEREAYARVLEQAVPPGGHVILATFAPDGPERCSGLPALRYDGEALARALGPVVHLVEEIRHEHRTPAGKVQPFTFARFVRRAVG
ncbi:MAG: class I SAM-dependent methyltransferase [Deltaproteobacteria bacterium]|nr:class I SAM-dependent methyltransferase [Deltaproteobacteria bacterium]